MNPILNPNTDFINDVISNEIVESNEKSMRKHFGLQLVVKVTWFQMLLIQCF